MNAIQAVDLTKYYGKTRGIEHVDLSVAEGDFFGFIGPNGAGKSTTIRTLLGLISPTSGKAEVLGMDITADKKSILANIGYLPAEVAFYGGLRVKEMLRLAADLRGLDCRAEAESLCQRLELDPTRKVDQLSLGNKKKVGIVCALQHRPKLYILDEPTSGLDPLMQREFYTILSERNADGATVFLSSHVLSEVQRYCKNAAVIRDGRILTCDSVERLGHTGAKRVLLRGVRELPQLPEIRDLKNSDDAISFLYSGEIQTLLQVLANLPITDLSVSEPDLEDVFLHYYEREDPTT